MKLFYNLSGSILATVKRFPAVFLLTFSTAICTSLIFITEELDGNYEDLEHALTALACSSIWCAVLSFPLQLFAEQSRKKCIQTILQIFCIAFCFIWYFFCLNLKQDRFFLVYLTTLLAVLALCPFALRHTQHANEIIPNIIASLFQSIVIVSAISIAVSIITFAVNTLFNLGGYITDTIRTAVLSFCWIAIFTDYFIINVTKTHIDISVPRFLGVIFSSVLVPLYAVFMIVLYIYLAKCAVTKSFPMRDMNLFCSIATALFITFSLSLNYFDTKTSKLFYIFAPFATIPLIAVQIAITIDRVSAHGISMNRYASMLYILFSIVALLLTFMQNRRFLLYLCPALSVIALVAGITPLNAIDVPIRSQTGIIRSVLKKNNLYENGIILTDKTNETLSDTDKATIIRAYKKIKDLDDSPFKKDFTETFGFDGIPSRNCSYYEFNINQNRNQSVDISSFKELYPISYDRDDNRICIRYADSSLDITDSIMAHMKKKTSDADDKSITQQEPLVITDSHGFTCIITRLTLTARTNTAFTDEEFELYRKDKSQWKFIYYVIDGFAVR
ncbi:MAG: DUF4153 domain-containing protein [Treponema sp.]|nr:DUF4153 domain-containing protein [Treponema sp.]